MAVRVITDSTAYLAPQLMRELGVDLVPLSTNLDGVTYDDDALASEAFYAALAASRHMPTTSAASVGQMTEAMERQLLAGNDVVGVFISAKLSSTFESAQMARAALLEKHPGASIEVVDGRSNSAELAFVVEAAARAAAAGESVARVAQAALEMTKRTRFLFVPHTLEYLRRGGRIGNAAALLGMVLRIRPILMASGGQTAVYAKVRGQQAAIEAILDGFAADIARYGLGGVVVQHIHAPEAGQKLAERVAAIAGRAVELSPIGPVIGAHVGPGAVGVAYHTVEPLLS